LGAIARTIWSRLKKCFIWNSKVSFPIGMGKEVNRELPQPRPRTFGTWEVLGKRIIPQRDSTISVWTEDQWTHKGPILWEKVSEANRNKWIRSTPCSHLPATTNAKLLRRVAKLLEITIYRFPLVYSGTSWICLPMGETTWTCHL
jgi:hypothetical protein